MLGNPKAVKRGLIMANRIGKLYKQNCTLVKLYEAYLCASKGKRYRSDVLAFRENLEANLISIRNDLLNHTYAVGPYREFYVNEPKRRLIMALSFRDRVVQWWVYNMLYPIFDPTFIHHSYACRRGYGQKASADNMQYWLRQVNALGGDWYYLKIDVAKYFYRVVHNTLLEILARKIKDPELLQLAAIFIKDNGKGFGLPLNVGLNTTERLHDRGMPIGNLTSQLFANVYLNELDQFCKHILKIRYYTRYMDDVIILGQNKQELREQLQAITDFLETHLQLQLNDKTTIRPVSMGVQFVGLTIWATHRTIRKSTSLRVRRRLMLAAKRYRLGVISFEKYNATLQSYLGLMKYASCHRFRTQLLAGVNTLINDRKDVVLYGTS